MRGSSRRSDNRGRAGPETEAVFRGVSLIGFRDVDEKRDVVTDEREEGVDVMREPGMQIGRDISREEAVEYEITAFIEKRHDRRVTDEGERPAEEAFMVSERAYFARLEAERRAAWREYLMDSADSIERTAAEIAATKRAQAARLMGETDKRGRAA